MGFLNIAELCFYDSVIYIFPSFATHFSGPFNIPILHSNALFAWTSHFHNFKLSAIISLKHLQQEQFWHKMASAENFCDLHL
jgi:hypothetical protein